jgi:tRNA pseudouridine13 synthase
MENEFTSWPRLLEPPSYSGAIRTLPEDFQVEEIPAYLPGGEGEHLFLLIEKISLTTEEVIHELASQLGVPRNSIGSAGLKDRRSISRQWLSLPAEAEKRLAGFQKQGIRILDARRHCNKLRTGHLRGNRFRILVRGLDPSCRLEMERRLSELVRRGFPHYFGPQRFGRNFNNLHQGLAVMNGKLKLRDGRKVRFVLSTVQSWLFNRVLAARLERGWFGRALAGDLLAFETGRFFPCTEPDKDQSRVDRLEVHPTGPLFGPEMIPPQGEPFLLETATLESSGLSPEVFERFARFTRGGRRPLRVVPKDVCLEQAAEGFWFCFFLPAGAYATSLLRELIEVQDAGEQAGDPAASET